MPSEQAAEATNGRSNGRKPRRPSNRDRILEASLVLFNRHGVVGTTTNSIAAHLGISPGNLYYHFANKEEIVRELWSQQAELGLPPIIEFAKEMDPPKPEDWATLFFVHAIEELWSYRFLYRDMDELAARDSELAESFRSTMSAARNIFTDTCRVLIQTGKMKAPVRDDDLERLSDNVLLILFGWLRFITTLWGRTEVQAGDIAEGGLHAFAVIEPYLERRFAARARAVIEAQVKERLPYVDSGA
jgi:AcrR family transcriptional regulator